MKLCDVLKRSGHPLGTPVLDETSWMVDCPVLELHLVERHFPELESLRRIDGLEVERAIIAVLHAVTESTEECEFFHVLTRRRLATMRFAVGPPVSVPSNVSTWFTAIVIAGAIEMKFVESSHDSQSSAESISAKYAAASSPDSTISTATPAASASSSADLTSGILASKGIGCDT